MRAGSASPVARLARRAWFAAWLATAPLPVIAAGPAELFEADVAVASQAPGLQADAFESALSEVLVRVAGDEAVLTSPAGRALLSDAPGLVQQYRYFTVPDSEPPQLNMRVRFDGEAVRLALQQEGLSYWGAERPDTLVWLAVEDRGQRYIVAADDPGEVRQALDRAAKQRGVPVIFPLMDLEDQSRVRFSDIWGGFFDQVLEGSARYNPQAVLIGRLNRSPSGGWSSQWDMNVSGRSENWRDADARLDTLLQNGIDDAAETMASQFAVAGSQGAEKVSITIEGVNTLAAYDRVSKYLDALTSVSGVQLEQVDGSVLTMGLRLNGSLQDLRSTVSIGSVIEPIAGASDSAYRVRW